MMAYRRLLLIALAAFLIEKGNAQNPDGDSLVCYDSINSYKQIGCLGATSTNIVSNGTGRPQVAGKVFRTTCTKSAEDIWILRNDNGIRTLRLKYDPNQCLTIDSFWDPSSLTPCNINNPAQQIVIQARNKDAYDPDYSYIHISAANNNNLVYQPGSGSNSYCSKWVWVSEVERKAQAVSDKNFVFPMWYGDLRKHDFQYVYAHQLMHSTQRYGAVTVSKDSCTDCKYPNYCYACFPIDYDTNNVVSTTVNLNLGLKTGGPSERFGTVNRVATGVFAKPFTTITIQMDNFDTKKVEIIASLYLHYDDSTRVSNWFRPPVVYVKESLQPGMNKIRSPFGGPLTIEVIGRDTTAQSIRAYIQGGVPMGTFTLGRTTAADWADELRKEPRWITIQGEHVVGLDVKAPYVNASFNQMVAMVKRFDLMLKNSFLISGYDLNPTNREDIHAVPQGQMWWYRDISGEYAGKAGTTIMINEYRDTDINLSLDNWVIWKFAHEFGHNFQNSLCYSDTFGSETTNNMYSAFQLAYFCGDGKETATCKTNTGAGYDFDQTFKDETAGYLAANQSFEVMLQKSAWAPLPFLLQLLAVYGYEPLRNMHRRFRERQANPNDNLCKGDKYVQFDAVYETWSEMVGQDLTAHFNKYRVPLSDAVRQRVASKNYPRPAVDISSVKLSIGTPLTWLPSGATPWYALHAFKYMYDAQ